MILVSLNIDLATGKAFLEGGGGNSGEWVTYIPIVSTSSSNKPSVFVFYNKVMQLFGLNISGSYDVGMPDFTVNTDSILAGNKSGIFGLIMWGQNKGGNTTGGETVWYYHNTVFGGDLRNGNIVFTAGAKGTPFGSQTILSYSSVAYLPESNWL
jgi:hypothetical protein